jgi:AcrR family transcriptional regulator
MKISTVRRPQLPDSVVVEYRRRRIAVTLAELAHQGRTAELTAGEIVTRTGISRTSFYGAFDNKEQAMHFACGLACNQLFAPVLASCSSLPAGGTRVERAVEGLIDGVLAEPLLAELCLVHGPQMLGRANVLEADAAVESMSLALGMDPSWSAKMERMGVAPEEFAAAAVLAAVGNRLRRGDALVRSELHGELLAIARGVLGETTGPSSAHGSARSSLIES